MAGLGPDDEPINPFGGIPLFGDLARLLGNQGPVNWEIARQMARWLATQGTTEANVDPMVRVRYEELYRIAAMHVAEATGLVVADSPVRVLTRSMWASEALDSWQPLMERLAEALSRDEGAGASDAGTSGAGTSVEEPPAGPDALMQNLAQSLSPMLLGLQSGSMVGHLAQKSLGTYDLPLPRENRDLVVVPANVDAFAEEWSLGLDDARMFVAVTETAEHAVLSIDHVRARFIELIGEYVSGFRPDTTALEDRIGAIDPTDMEALQSAFGDPEALLGAMSSPEQEQAASRLSAAVAALIGYVDHFTATIAGRLVGSPGLLQEAQRRRRVAKGQGERFVERLFGLEMTRTQIETGTAFVNGVIERADESALVRLWTKPDALPTPAEIVAPGLWLERISYGEAGAGGAGD